MKLGEGEVHFAWMLSAATRSSRTSGTVKIPRPGGCASQAVTAHTYIKRDVYVAELLILDVKAQGPEGLGVDDGAQEIADAAHPATHSIRSVTVTSRFMATITHTNTEHHARRDKLVAEVHPSCFRSPRCGCAWSAPSSVPCAVVVRVFSHGRRGHVQMVHRNPNEDRHFEASNLAHFMGSTSRWGLGVAGGRQVAVAPEKRNMSLLIRFWAIRIGSHPKAVPRSSFRG